MKITVLGAAGNMGRRHTYTLLGMGHEVRCSDPAGLQPDIAKLDIKHSSPFSNGTMVPDAIVIASPAAMHLEGLLACVNSGVHVFVEKPLCLIGETERAESILQAADDKGLVVATGYNLRFHPKVQWVKDLIARDDLRPIWGSFLLRQKMFRSSAHFLEEWASHEIDLALHLLGPVRHDGRHIMRGDYGANVDIFLEHDSGNLSFSRIDAIKNNPYCRAFTVIDECGQSVTCDIEKDHVQPEHYKAELTEWINQIQFGCKRPEASPLATGWEGLDVIKLLKRLKG